MSEICVISMKVSSEGQVLLVSITLIKPAKKENESSVCIITYTRQQAERRSDSTDRILLFKNSSLLRCMKTMILSGHERHL